jgi:hypothetical protein
MNKLLSLLIKYRRRMLQLLIPITGVMIVLDTYVNGASQTTSILLVFLSSIFMSIDIDKLETVVEKLEDEVDALICESRLRDADTK